MARVVGGVVTVHDGRARFNCAAVFPTCPVVNPDMAVTEIRRTAQETNSY